MILTIDLGNTNIVFGLFKGKKLIDVWRCRTSKLKIKNVKERIDAVIICSVVPALNNKLKSLIRRQFGLAPAFVTARNIPGLKVRLKNKREIGADRVVDALAAYELYGGPAIIVDFGTATTLDLVSSRGEYLGGVIAPGVLLARDALYERAAKLPRITVKAPKKVLGRDTVSAMQSGLVHGYVSLIEGLVARLKKEQGTRQCLVVATGGLAGLICKHTDVIDRIDRHLTLKGLAMIGAEIKRAHD
ncbi:MAG: type III pantothenate kinase [Candidatus Saganbacteria bacterium]|nr:type III pantothenate kinase [Candidatus Saganbacteria bacterium]